MSSHKRVRWSVFVISIVMWLLMAAVAALAQNSLSVTRASAFAVSPRVVDLNDDNEQHPATERRRHPLPNRDGQNGQNQDDDARQQNPEPRVKAFPRPSFNGIGANGFAPPDTNIAVGPNHIVETVNLRYAVYNKSGALLVGPKALSALWSPLGAPCGANTGSDPIAQYDKVADRWVVTQMGSTSAPYFECIAVSQTGDPTGSFFLYSFAFNSTLNDYPKFGVWPTATNSAYLATYNLFANGAVSTRGGLCAYDRAAMLAGAAAPVSICFTITNDGGYLPSDLDGSTPPLDGTPGYFATFETLSSLRIYTLKPNFGNPNASVLTQATPDLAVTLFTQACGGATCIPQAGTTQLLDSLGDRLMYRLAFRMFPDHEALVVNHSVGTATTVGVRWYELRAPVSATGAFSVFQQGTFSPADGIYRWMGSAAMDRAGDIALGYSASSTSIHPAIRYTGRTPSDPAGTMGTEASLIEGPGSQTGGLSRWGDYTALRIDPSDDCTFWYANEYLPANGSFNWTTFIGSFKFSGCPEGGPDFSISASPASQTVLKGNSTTYTVTVTPAGGFTGTVTLSASGLPIGASASFNPGTITTSGSSTMTVTTSASTPPGTYTLIITGSSGNLTHSTTVTLVVTGPSPDFAITATPPTRTVGRPASTTYTVTVTPLNGFSGAVSFSVSGLPSRTTASFNPASVNGRGTSTMTVSTRSRTPRGTFVLTIRGTSGNVVHSTTVTLVVQ